MELSKTQPGVDIPSGLIDAIRTFPTGREVTHCGVGFTVSPFEIYARCPNCGTQIKLRSFSGAAEVEDVFDAVFDWIDRTHADDLVRQRLEALRADRDD